MRRFVPGRFFFPIYGYQFSIRSSLIDQDFIMLMCSTLLASVNSYYKCAAITVLCDDLYLVASDLVISKCLPKQPLMCYYNSFTVIICLAQLIRTAAFCSDAFDLGLDTIHYFMACIVLLVLLYVLKLYLLVLLLQRFSVQLQSVLLLPGGNSVSIFPITITYCTTQPMEWVNYESGNLLILMMIIEKLEKTFLRCREEVLAKNDSSHKKVYYDDNMDIMALYFSTKEQLQRCRGDYEEVTNEYHEYKENAECNIKELKKQLNTLKKDLTKLKETKENIKQLQCCICHDNQPDILLRPCNHLSLCESCLKKMTKKYCPLCRKKIKETIKVFS